MPRNPRPDQIGMGGRMLSVQVAGSPRNTQEMDEDLLDQFHGTVSLPFEVLAAPAEGS